MVNFGLNMLNFGLYIFIINIQYNMYIFIYIMLYKLGYIGYDI